MFEKIPKQIDTKHLVYLGVIFIIITGLLLSLLFGDSPYAGEMLNFGATLSSIILAIVAILITLLDVAGQKSSILEIKESSKKIEKVMIKSEEMLLKTEEQFHNISTLTDQLANTMQSNIELYNDLRKIVSETSDEKIDKNAIASVIVEYEKKKEKPVQVKVTQRASRATRLIKKSIIKRLILDEYERGQQFTLDELKIKLKTKNHEFTDLELNRILKDLIWAGTINIGVKNGKEIFEVVDGLDLDEDESN
jgi:Mn2+/Fe2+ NRAMP family transporter